MAGRFTDFADALKRVYSKGSLDKFINSNAAFRFDPRGELIAMKVEETNVAWGEENLDRFPKTTEEALVERAVLKLADENNWKTYIWSKTQRPNITKASHHKGVVWWASFEIKGRRVDRLLRFAFRLREGEVVFEAMNTLQMQLERE